MSTQVLGEQSLQVTTPNIRVVATQMSSVSDFLFYLGDVKFHMPTDIEKQLNVAPVGKEGTCFGTMMIVYQENPFFSEMVRVVRQDTVIPLFKVYLHKIIRNQMCQVRFNKLTSVFYASVLLMMINFVITLSKCCGSTGRRPVDLQQTLTML